MSPDRDRSLVAPDGDGRRAGGRSALDTDDTHGTGCTLASAIACGLGGGLPIQQAVEQAVRFVRLAILDAPGFGAGHGPIGHQAVTDFRWDDLDPEDAPARRENVGAMNLNQVTLPARDYEASVDFYRRARASADRRLAAAVTPASKVPGGATLSLHMRTGRGSRATRSSIFECDDLDEGVERLRGGGYRVRAEGRRTSAGAGARPRDPPAM